MSGKNISDGRDQNVAQASLKWLERVDISSTDHTYGLNGGVAFGINCDTAGEILKIDNTTQTGFTTVALQAGYNPIEITKIWKTGSTITGNIDIGSW